MDPGTGTNQVMRFYASEGAGSGTSTETGRGGGKRAGHRRGGRSETHRARPAGKELARGWDLNTAGHLAVRIPCSPSGAAGGTGGLEASAPVSSPRGPVEGRGSANVPGRAGGGFAGVLCNLRPWLKEVSPGGASHNYPRRRCLRGAEARGERGPRG